MPIGRGSRYNPATGERQDYEFEYTPASQMPNYGSMQFDMRKAMEQLGVQQAEQAMIAATRYQGQRGYQQDLQNGVAPDQALAKWGPLMFFSKTTTGAGSMINALKPPQMTPYQQGMLDLQRKRFEATQNKPVEPKVYQGPQGQFFKVNPDSSVTEIRPPNARQQTISPSTAAGIVFDPVKDAYAKAALGDQYTNLTNIAKSGILPNEPTAQPVPITAAPVAATASTPATAEVKRYNDEDEARKAGAKAGDVIYLKGIGKVRLK